MDPQILSLDEFADEAPPTDPNATDAAQGHSIQLMGGLLATPSPETRTLRKRRVPAAAKAKQRSRHQVSSDSIEASKSFDGDEGGGAPQRGRPRLDASNQTRGERRRTQIRLAQRAYRQRKETTIMDLNERVADLERSIGVMNQIVADFRDTAAASGLYEIQPGLAQSLQTVALRVNDIASSNAPSQDNRPRARSPNLSARIYPAAETGETIEPTNAIESGTDDSAFKERSTETSMTSPWGYVFGTEEEAQAGKEGDSYDASASLIDEQQPLMETANNSDESYSLIPLSTKSLAPPLTYTFQESTFARRLLRAAYERAYRVMLDPARNADIIEKMCRFTFCYNSFDSVRRWLYHVAKRPEAESLELWSATLLHIGGAGLHYPRTSLDGSGSAPPIFWADKSPMGPNRGIPHTQVPEWMTPDQVIEYTGFQGDWFDPNDVEHYLQSKGVYVDARSSLAELDATLDPTLKAPIATPFGSFNSPSTGSEQESYKNAEIPISGGSPLPNVGDLVAAAGTDLDFAMYPDRWSSSSGASYRDPLLDDNYAFTGTRSKQILDVDKFISTIIEQAICLGRTPGWRKESIDSAIAASVQEVF